MTEQQPTALADFQAASAARRLRDALEPIGAHAYWSDATGSRGRGLGLKGLSAYVYGRGAFLGDVAPAVVAAAFGWFEPDLIAQAFARAAAEFQPEDVLPIRAEAATASLSELLAGQPVAGTADALVEAARAAPRAGRCLFAGRVAAAVPSEPAGRLWWACEALREYRGDSHLIAVAAAGVDPIVMNVLTELWTGMPIGSYTATRGWSAPAIEAAIDRAERRGWVGDGQLTAAGAQLRAGIEAVTDRQCAPVLDALGPNVEEIIGRLDQWSALLIAAKAFPDDIAKRLAG
ncbi:MAG: hypothetical protein JWO63_749 [Frankiales bacterium]|nr:hypothetical protein [Frankiales bacterium]